jgi:orotate phosphoribosyltransferase
MSYLEDYLTGKEIKKVVTKAARILKKANFDTIAVRGNSGLLIGVPLAVEMNKNLIIVRKNTSDCHSSNRLEGWGKNQKILLLDDFIETGKTVKVMHKEIELYCDSPEIVGLFLYAHKDLDRCSYSYPRSGKQKKNYPILAIAA